MVGGAPPIAPALPLIAAHVGIDRDPVDVGDAGAARWQLACVWPDTNRLPRTRRTLDMVHATPPRLVRGDAVETVREVVSGLPAGVVPVVITTWALAYLSIPDRVAFREELAAASGERTIAWISGEGPGVVDLFAGIEPPSDAQGMEASLLGLVVFRDGDLEPGLLAFVHPHGSWIDWRP